MKNNMPMNMMFNAPIPGENYTSDTRNYPWHRPPEYTLPDDALEWISKKLMKKEGRYFVLTMLGFGLTVKEIVSTILMKGFSQGKWTMDLALIIAGPLSHMIVLLAKQRGVEYDLGIESNAMLPTDTFFKNIKKLKQNRSKKSSEKKLKEDMESVKDKASLSGGFMDIESEEPPSVEMDEEMLGEEEEVLE